MSDARSVCLSQIHVAPLDDVIVHEMNGLCPCEPNLVTEPDDEGAPVICYRHKVVGEDVDGYNHSDDEDDQWP